MAYEKTNWVDRLDTGNKYRIIDNGDGTKAIEYAGEVIREGTPMSAANFNKMEDGIETAQQTAENNLQAAKDYTDEKFSEIPEGKTYSFAEGTENGTIRVTPDGEAAQNVPVHGLGSAAYTPATDYATAAQGGKADSAVQEIQIEGVTQTKTNGVVNLPKSSNITYGTQDLIDGVSPLPTGSVYFVYQESDGG